MFEKPWLIAIIKQKREKVARIKEDTAVPILDL